MGKDNKEPVKRGRPFKYNDEKVLSKRIDEYFESCWRDRVNAIGELIYDSNGKVIREQYKPYTLTGLAYDLDVDTETLRNYAKSELFGALIARAKQKCEVYANEELFRTQGSTKGVEFNLNINHKWNPKQEVEIRTITAADLIDEE